MAAPRPARIALLAAVLSLASRAATTAADKGAGNTRYGPACMGRLAAAPGAASVLMHAQLACTHVPRRGE